MDGHPNLLEDSSRYQVLQSHKIRSSSDQSFVASSQTACVLSSTGRPPVTAIAALTYCITRFCARYYTKLLDTGLPDSTPRGSDFYATTAPLDQGRASAVAEDYRTVAR